MMQRLPGSVLSTSRPAETLGGLFRSIASVAACADAACLASRTGIGAAAALAAASGNAFGGPIPQHGWPSVPCRETGAAAQKWSSLKGMHTAAVAGQPSCSMSVPAASPKLARQLFATAGQQAAEQQQQQQAQSEQQGVSTRHDDDIFISSRNCSDALAHEAAAAVAPTGLQPLTALR